MKFSYKELGGYFADPLPAVEELAQVLTMHSSEVEEIIPQGENNWEMEIKILPDRTEDAKTPLGLAHEISALFPQLKLKEDWLLPDQNSARAKIVFSAQNINDLLGTNLNGEEIIGLLNRVRVNVIKSDNGENLTALITPERQDLNIKEDLADEVARLLGYNQIETQILTADLTVKHNPDFVLANKVRAKMTAEGYTEIYGYTFIDHGELAVEKPLAQDKNYLRTNLSEGMKKAIEFNLGYILFDQDEVKLFEIGSIFSDGQEEIHVATGYGVKKPELKIEVIEKKLSDFETELQTASDNLDQLMNQEVNYRPVSPYPRIVRDVAVWIPAETTVETIAELIKKSAGDLCVEGPILFDEFTKEGRKSLAFRLVFQSHEKTLSDNEVNSQMDQVIKVLESQANFEVRK